MLLYCILTSLNYCMFEMKLDTPCPDFGSRTGSTAHPQTVHINMLTLIGSSCCSRPLRRASYQGSRASVTPSASSYRVFETAGPSSAVSAYHLRCEYHGSWLASGHRRQVETRDFTGFRQNSSCPGSGCFWTAFTERAL